MTKNVSIKNVSIGPKGGRVKSIETMSQNMQLFLWRLPLTDRQTDGRTDRQKTDVVTFRAPNGAEIIKTEVFSARYMSSFSIHSCKLLKLYSLVSVIYFENKHCFYFLRLLE